MSGHVYDLSPIQMLPGTIVSLVTIIKPKAKENHCAGTLVYYDTAV
jgi:hypothetical protein